MIDIHSHFLPGIDDGARDFSQSKKMLQQAEDEGITNLISTPHFNEFVSDNYINSIENEFDKVNNWINENNLKLSIHFASEILMDNKIFKWQKIPKILHGVNANYFLFELPHFFEFNDVSETIFKLKLQHLTPILAHPERCIKLQQSPSEIIKWVEQGCVMQMNAGSILGQFGKNCFYMAKKFLEAGVIHVVASDAHEHKSRNFKVLKKAKDYILQNFDEEFAEILFNQNPGNILDSKPVKFFKINSENLEINKIKNILTKLRLNKN